MNTLSWILYLTDFLSNVKSLLIAVGVGLFGWGALRAIIHFIAGLHKGDTASYTINSEREKQLLAERDYYWGMMQTSWKQFSFAAVFFFFVTLIPSQKIMYAIALSEIGERVIKLEQVTKLSSETTELVHSFIQRAKRELDGDEKKK